MRSYVINLDRAHERWDFISVMCAERGLEVERVPAVDGSDLSETEFETLRAGSLGKRPMLRAEVACFESHKAVWRRIVAAPDPVALVLEDDVFLARSVAGITAGIADAMAGLDLVKLNAYHRPVLMCARPLAEVEGRGVCRVLGRSSDSSAYLVTRDFAARALDLHARYAEAVDLALFDPVSGIRLAVLVPSLSVQAKMADFGFLPEAAAQSAIQGDRGAKPGGPMAVVRSEARRLWRRRIAPLGLPLGNLFRSRGARRVSRRVEFLDG